jgi:hypothetical protein
MLWVIIFTTINNLVRVFFVAPALIFSAFYALTGGFSARSFTTDTKTSVFFSSVLIAAIAWLVGGFIISKFWGKRQNACLMALVRSVAPANFSPAIEIKGRFKNEYIGISPATKSIIIIDLQGNICRCENLDFYQGWTTQDRDQRYTCLTLRFNDFDLPSIKVIIPTRIREDITAKLNYAVNFPMDSTFPPADPAELLATLKTKYGDVS